ncbi:MAG: tRNA/rRNA methyltransferase [Bacteroidia bacterium]|nr:MAG: tRNA/rRNA methyltransferase [Bacteroidia bacterium]
MKKNKKLSLEELKRISVNEFKISPKLPLIVILDNIRSLNNVGSFFRTCDAFRVEKLYLTGGTGCPPNKEIYKTALGAENSVEWEYHTDIMELITALNKKGYQIVVAEQTEHSIALTYFEPQPKTALVFGNEVNGVNDSVIENADYCIEIPQYGTKHSLNVAVSAGIIIHYFSDYLLKHYNIKI